MPKRLAIVDDDRVVVLVSEEDLAVSLLSRLFRFRPRQNVVFELGYFIGKSEPKERTSLCRFKRRAGDSE
jgi:predicted nucleotide-binding protein